MKTRLITLLLALAFAIPPLHAQTAAPPDTVKLLGDAVLKLYDLVSPPRNGVASTVALDLRMVAAEGVPKEFAGQTLSLVVRAPDRLKVTSSLLGTEVTMGRHGDEIWLHAPEKKLGLLGRPEIPRFASDPASTEPVKLDALVLPVDKSQIGLLPALLEIKSLPDETIGGQLCRVIAFKPTQGAREALNLQDIEIEAALRQSDTVPARLAIKSGPMRVVMEVLKASVLDPAPDESFWQIPQRPGDTIEKVALAHLTKFMANFTSTLSNHIPTLGPATGEKKLVAREGAGRLELHDGTRVLFLKGTPEEMGHQHGVLLANEIRDVVGRILYGVGVGSSFGKGRWFFGEIEAAQARLEKFMNPRYLREMDAIAATVGLHPQEARLANFFPELFHCTGFSLFGTATVDGTMYHGRVLDYLAGMGLEQNAVVMVFQPDQGNAWVNCGYAGFVGSITAMNEKHLSIGEMGGQGQGDWDGKPMAQLMREVMEKADTIEQGIEIFRKSPRTCEYYYVISDGKSGRACGIKGTPKSFEVIWAGESHPQLPHPIKDTVLMSAGDRYTELVRRVEEGKGKFTAESARALMTKPVCMGSNIQSVLFAPQSLDFWVANADSQNVASHTRFTKYNLRDLLDSTKEVAEKK